MPFHIWSNAISWIISRFCLSQIFNSSKVNIRKNYKIDNFKKMKRKNKVPVWEKFINSIDLDGLDFPFSFLCYHSYRTSGDSSDIDPYFTEFDPDSFGYWSVAVKQAEEK